MAAYTIVQYLNARLPDLATDLPTVDASMLATGAMAVYWSFFTAGQDPVPQMDEAILSERQKLICALRAAVTIFPSIMMLKAKSGLLAEAHGGPAGAKFADPSKLYKQIGDMLLKELELLEFAEGISLEPTVGIPPAYLLSVGYPIGTVETGTPVVSRNIIDVGTL